MNVDELGEDNIYKKFLKITKYTQQVSLFFVFFLFFSNLLSSRCFPDLLYYNVLRLRYKYRSYNKP